MILKPATIDGWVVGLLNQATIFHLKLPHYATVGEKVPEKLFLKTKLSFVSCILVRSRKVV